MRALARRARGEAPACRMVHARAPRVKLLYIWHYVSDSIPTKLFWGLTFSSAGGLSEEKYQSQFGNIFPVALFCPPLPFVPPSQVLAYFCSGRIRTQSSPVKYSANQMLQLIILTVAQVAPTEANLDLIGNQWSSSPPRLSLFYFELLPFQCSLPSVFPEATRCTQRSKSHLCEASQLQGHVSIAPAFEMISPWPKSAVWSQHWRGLTVSPLSTVATYFVPHMTLWFSSNCFTVSVNVDIVCQSVLNYVTMCLLHCFSNSPTRRLGQSCFRHMVYLRQVEFLVLVML